MRALLTEPQLAALGAELARGLAPGSVVWLEGPLGAGKTTLVRALVAARGAEGAATSPTFNLVHRYEGARGAVFHVDCYRLRDPEEASELDWGGMASADLVLVEWPARAGAWAPHPTVRVLLSHVEDPGRRGVELMPPLAPSA